MTERRNRPGSPGAVASTPPRAGSDSTAHRSQDGYAAPTAEDRREAELVAELQALGYGITVPCLVCRHPLTSAKSVARHIGPKCATKAAAEAVVR
jgi:hypothetical protein